MFPRNSSSWHLYHCFILQPAAGDWRKADRGGDGTACGGAGGQASRGGAGKEERRDRTRGAATCRGGEAHHGASAAGRAGETAAGWAGSAEGQRGNARSFGTQPLLSLYPTPNPSLPDPNHPPTPNHLSDWGLNKWHVKTEVERSPPLFYFSECNTAMAQHRFHQGGWCFDTQHAKYKMHCSHFRVSTTYSSERYLWQCIQLFIAIWEIWTLMHWKACYSEYIFQCKETWHILWYQNI